MKKVYISLLLVLFLGIVRSQNTAADLGVAAIGLVVSDIEKSEKFYTQIIGMSAAGAFSLDEEWSKEAGASGNRPFSVKMFKIKEVASSTILKLAYFDKVAPRPPQTGIDVNAGVNYLTFHLSMDDFKSTVDRIKKAKIDIIGWVKRDTYQLLFIKDPDGVFVELVGPPVK